MITYNSTEDALRKTVAIAKKAWRGERLDNFLTQISNNKQSLKLHNISLIDYPFYLDKRLYKMISYRENRLMETPPNIEEYLIRVTEAIVMYEFINSVTVDKFTPILPGWSNQKTDLDHYFKHKRNKQEYCGIMVHSTKSTLSIEEESKSIVNLYIKYSIPFFII